MKSIRRENSVGQEKKWEIPEFLKIDKIEKIEEDNENDEMEILRLQARQLDKIGNNIVSIKGFLFVIVIILIVMFFK